MIQVGSSGFTAIPDDTPSAAMNTLLETSRVLGTTLELVDLMQAAVSGACHMTGLETGAIYTLDEESLYLQATEPPLPPGFPEELLSAPLSDHPHIAQAIAKGSSLRVPDVSTQEWTPAEEQAVKKRGLTSIMYMPIPAKDGVHGVFMVATTNHPERFREVDEKRVSRIAEHVALAIDSAALHNSLAAVNVDRQHLFDDALTGWASALETRDYLTGQHCSRVGDLTLQLAARLGVPDEEHEHIRRGVKLHDIGKMVVPDDILLKPGPLTEDEWEVMKQHPQVAREFMADIEFLQPAIDIPYCHHERWDGTGYPQGLAGDEIPLAARIFAVVDVYDALTSDRPYRDAWSHERAIEHIASESGEHFDPLVVETFIDIVREA